MEALLKWEDLPTLGGTIPCAGILDSVKEESELSTSNYISFVTGYNVTSYLTLLPPFPPQLSGLSINMLFL